VVQQEFFVLVKQGFALCGIDEKHLGRFLQLQVGGEARAPCADDSVLPYSIDHAVISSPPGSPDGTYFFSRAAITWSVMA
jgi:hypothetical protein